MCEIPAAAGRPLHPAGGHPAGRFHDAPPSWLRQIPPPEVVAKSSRAVAMTMLGSSEAITTSTAKSVGNASRCWKLTPPSNVRNRPPLSVATTSRFASDWLTAIATARPPAGTFGGTIVTSECGPHAESPAPTSIAITTCPRILMAHLNVERQTFGGAPRIRDFSPAAVYSTDASGPVRISVSSSLLVAAMNQNSSLREGAILA